jgi:hypothetical protein
MAPAFVVRVVAVFQLKKTFSTEHNTEPNPRLCDLLYLFPHRLVRRIQVAALEVVAWKFTEDSRFAIVEAPASARKPAEALVSARYVSTLDDGQFESGVYVLTPCNLAT